MSDIHASQAPQTRDVVTPPEHAFNTASILEQTLDRTLEMIRAVDVKTALYMGIATGMMAALPAVVRSWDQATAWTWIILAIGTAGPLASCVLCAAASFPQTEAARPSDLFFGTIAAEPEERYVKSALSKSEPDYRADLAHQVHRNAVIAAWKYRRLRHGLCVLFAGLGPWLVSIYLLASGR